MPPRPVAAGRGGQPRAAEPGWPVRAKNSRVVIIGAGWIGLDVAAAARAAGVALIRAAGPVDRAKLADPGVPLDQVGV